MKSIFRNSFLTSSFKSFSKPALRLKTNQPEPAFNPYLPITTFKQPHYIKEEGKTLVLKKKEIAYSAMKMNHAIQPVRGKYLTEAVKILEKINTKGSKIAREMLTSFYEKHQEHSTVHREFLVKEAWVGRKKGKVSIYYRGRGKVNFKVSPICHLNLKLECIPTHKIHQLAMEGSATTPFIEHVKESLIVNQASMEEIKRWSFVLTGAGRRYRRTQLSRLAWLLQTRIHKKYDILISRDLLLKEIKRDLFKALEPVKNHAEKLNEVIPQRTTEEEYLSLTKEQREHLYNNMDQIKEMLTEEQIRELSLNSSLMDRKYSEIYRNIPVFDDSKGEYKEGEYASKREAYLYRRRSAREGKADEKNLEKEIKNRL